MQNRYMLVAVAAVLVVVVAAVAVMLTGGDQGHDDNEDQTQDEDKTQDGEAKSIKLQGSVAFGELNNESFEKCAIDASGNLYIAGTIDGDTVLGAGHDPSFNGGVDLVVLKYTPDLSGIVAGTYLGGSNDETISDIVIGPDGSVYVLGWTTSMDFPVTEGAYNTSNPGKRIFVAQLSADLGTLLHSTFLGDGWSYGIATDGHGSVYICGFTNDASFPATEGSYDRQLAGNSDAFVAKFSPDLSALQACTFLGGPGSDSAQAIALDADGHVYITGVTYYRYDPESEETHVPVTDGAFSTEIGGSSDAYIAELSSDLSDLLASTLLGGSNDDFPLVITISMDGSIMVAGSTDSTDFPITGGALRSDHQGIKDAFISRLSPNLGDLRGSTYLGLGAFSPTELVEGSDGQIFMSASGVKPAPKLPTTDDAFLDQFGGYNNDGFMLILDAGMSKVAYASFIGGNRDEQCTMGLGPDGTLYVVGFTYSTNFLTLEDDKREQDGGYWSQRDGFILRFKST